MTSHIPSSPDEKSFDDGYRSRHKFSGCRTNVDVLDSVLATKKHLLGDMSRLRVFAVGDGEGGQALRSNHT